MKQGPELTKLIEAIRSAVIERDTVAASVAAQMEIAEQHLRVAHHALDDFLAGGAPTPIPAEPLDESAPPLADESGSPEASKWRRKVAAGLIDEAPCESLARHDPHLWDDEVATVFCPGAERAIKI